MRLARDTYLEALSAAKFAGRLASGGGVREAAEAARAAPAPAPPLRASDLLLDGLAVLLAAGYAAGAPTLKLALEAFRSADIPGDEALRWTWLACRTAIDLWDYETWDVLSIRLVELTRRRRRASRAPARPDLTDGVAPLRSGAGPGRLADRGGGSTHRGDGEPARALGALLLSAWQGREAEASGVIKATIAEVVPRGEALGLTAAQWATAVLYNGLGRFEEARVAAEQASERAEDLGFSNWSLVELVEAASRSGRPDARPAPLSVSRRHTPQRHRLGAGDRGPLPGAVERGRDRRDPVRRGDRPARPRARPHGARPSPSPLRRVAAPRAPANRRARAAAHRPRDAGNDGPRGIRRAGQARVVGHWRDCPQADCRDPRRAHPPGDPDRAARPGRIVEPGNRGQAVHQSTHGQIPPP